MEVREALRRRTSIRAYLERPVERDTLLAILDDARWSPSGGNLQPWKVIAVAGDERDAVSKLALDTLMKNPAGEADDAPIYPSPLWEPYRTRRFELGEAMYELLEIPRSDRARRLRQFSNNYRFFGAPLGLFFVIDRRLGRGQWAHLGMFMQSLALAATERGLGCCFQEAWAMVRRSLHRHFDLDDNDLLYCGMALGWPDPEAPVNRLRSARLDPLEFTALRGL